MSCVQHNAPKVSVLWPSILELLQLERDCSCRSSAQCGKTGQYVDNGLTDSSNCQLLLLYIIALPMVAGNIPVRSDFFSHQLAADSHGMAHVTCTIPEIQPKIDFQYSGSPRSRRHQVAAASRILSSRSQSYLCD